MWTYKKKSTEEENTGEESGKYLVLIKIDEQKEKRTKYKTTSGKFPWQLEPYIPNWVELSLDPKCVNRGRFWQNKIIDMSF